MTYKELALTYTWHTMQKKKENMGWKENVMQYTRRTLESLMCEINKCGRISRHGDQNGCANVVTLQHAADISATARVIMFDAEQDEQ